MRPVALVPCTRCGTPVLPAVRFLPCFGKESGQSMHAAVCKHLCRLQSNFLCEAPNSTFSRLIDGVSPRTAGSIRAYISKTVLDQLQTGVMAAETLAHVVISLCNGSAEQRLLSSLPSEAQTALEPFLAQRLRDAGVYLSTTGSFVVRGSGSEGSSGFSLTRAVDRVMTGDQLTPRPWPLNSSGDSPRKSMRWSTTETSLRHASPRLTSLRMSMAYWNMRGLVHLDLSTIKMCEFPPAITSHMRSLVVLSARSCGLERLPETIDALDELEELNVSNNNLTVLPVALGHLRKLRSLVFSRNNVTHLQAALFGMPALEVLIANHNLLHRLPETNLAALPNLRHIDTSGNRLPESPRQLATAPALRYLDLSGNTPKLELAPEFTSNRDLIVAR